MSATAVDTKDLYAYLLRLGDDALVMSHRIAEWTSWAPQLEEDMALVNIGLDLLGQVRNIYTYAGVVGGEGKTEDDLAYLREEHEFTCVHLVEHPTVHHFGRAMAQLFYWSAYAVPLWEQLSRSSDSSIAEIAVKSLKEARYHLEHAAAWVVRLGDGTEESHGKIQEALDHFWPYTGDLFRTDELNDRLVAAGVAADLATVKAAWDATVASVLAEATLPMPTVRLRDGTGRAGTHTEHLGYLLAEMQYIHRLHPGASW